MAKNKMNIRSDNTPITGLPIEWDEKRIQDVIDYYDQQTEDEAIAEAEEALQNDTSTLMAIPTELVQVVLDLINKHTAKEQK